MSGLKVGYARVSTSEQDLTVQRNALLAFGVDEEHIFVDHGLTGTNRARPGLREAMAAVRAGDTLVVSKLDRLARSLPDARDIADELTAKGVSLSLGGSTYDPADPVGRLRGKQPNLSAVQRKHLLSLYETGEHTQAELAELFSVSRTTVYREIQRCGDEAS